VTNERVVMLAFEGVAWAERMLLKFEIDPEVTLQHVQLWASCLQASCAHLSVTSTEPFDYGEDELSRHKRAVRMERMERMEREAGEAAEDKAAASFAGGVGVVREPVPALEESRSRLTAGLQAGAAACTAAASQAASTSAAFAAAKTMDAFQTVFAGGSGRMAHGVEMATPQEEVTAQESCSKELHRSGPQPRVESRPDADGGMVLLSQTSATSAGDESPAEHFRVLRM
jgi:hypothetical protein